ncbi:MAG: hypothetical protein Q9216_004180 [Gyalolechia sp. 2 TL-2023]
MAYPPGKEIVPLRTAITTTPLDSHSYLANIPLDHCYLKTAHGGLLVSVVVVAIQQYFRSNQTARSHPDTFSIDTAFLRPAGPGEVTVVIKDVKPGSNFSTVHFALLQDGKDRLVGYAMNTNLDAEKGISFPTPSALNPQPPPADLKRLATQSDPNWIGYSVPWHPTSFLKAISHLQFFSPSRAFTPANITDSWIRLAADDQKFTTEMLGSVADHWRRMIENYAPNSMWRQEKVPARAAEAVKEGKDIQGFSTSYGYPTLSMHLEIKKKLPTEGAEWLFMRARSTVIKNGRFDAEILILDEHLDVVALSHQVALVTKSMQIPDNPREPRNSHL